MMNTNQLDLNHQKMQNRPTFTGRATKLINTMKNKSPNPIIHTYPSIWR